MLPLRNLRVRISVAFFAISVLLSGLFAVATFFCFEFIRPSYSEKRYFDDLDQFVVSRRLDPGPGLWETPEYRAYIAERGDFSTLPERLRGLEPGRHQIEHQSVPSEIQVEDRGALRYLLEYDIDQIEAIEGEVTRFLVGILGAGVLATALLALGFGYWISHRIIQPVTSLARRVEALDAQQLAELPSGEYGTDEVADLARAFEHHIRRLGRFVQREKDFAADTSHELRTSVASMSSSIELLKTEGHGEPTRSRLDRLQRASRHMGKLIEALLVLSRDGNASEPRPAALDAIGPTLREIVDSRRPAASGRGVEIELDISRAGNVRAPTEGLSMVVGNLIDNALAYAPDGVVRVCLEGDLLEIADDGPGIPEHELPYVFQRAFRGRYSAGRGVGLGLSIVQRLCQHHGWQIAIESPSGVGTSVRIDFAPPPASEQPR